MSKDKKSLQLGINSSTASGRLVKDLLFKFAVDLGHKCFQCGEDLTRDTFSVEHKEPWLDSEDPRGKFFDLENIAFSHISCNSGAARRNRASCPSKTDYAKGCRCEPCTTLEAERKKRIYTKEKRRVRYLRTGS